VAIHDWTTIFAGGFHHFHQAWVLGISNQLNTGVLPDGYFAAAEQSTGRSYPDVVALELDVREPGAAEDSDTTELRQTGGIAVTDAPPRVRFSFDSEVFQYAEMADRIAIRSLNRNKIVAVIEVVSPGNKHSGLAFGKFREKVHYLIRHGIQVMIIDLFPPGKFDPQGISRGLQIESDSIVPAVTNDEPLSLVSLRVTDHVSGFVELCAVGQDVPTMPLFLSDERYVNVPLNDSYIQAWSSLPNPWKEIVEGRRQATE